MKRFVGSGRAAGMDRSFVPRGREPLLAFESPTARHTKPTAQLQFLPSVLKEVKQAHFQAKKVPLR